MIITEQMLRKGIEKGEFIPFYQPIVCADTKIIMGCEVLARWLTKEQGTLTASHFIDGITQFDLTRELMSSLVEKILSEFTTPRKRHTDRGFFLSLNINLSMIMDPQYACWLITLCDELYTRHITTVIEITEREDIALYPNAESIFCDLEARGMIFAVDDFGTGFSTEMLETISKARFIKLDRQYVSHPGNPEAERFIDKLMWLAKKEDAMVIAEGIETLTQEKWLISKGIDFLQGYRYGHALPYHQFHSILNRETEMV